MIGYYKRSSLDKNIRTLNKFESGCWINVTDPSDEEISYLTEKFELDKECLLSALNPHEIPWVDYYGGKTYIMTSAMASIESHELRTFLVVVSKNFTLTVMKSQPNIIKRILNNDIRFITSDSRTSLLKIIHKMSQEFEKSIIDIEKSVNRVGRLTSMLKEKDVTMLLKYEDALNKLASSYNHNIIVYGKLYKKASLSSKHKNMLKDIVTEYSEGFEMCKNSLKNISNLRNYYLILLSNRLNRIITIFTIFTIIISIPAAVSGLYGMNILLPMQNSPSAFTYIILIVIALWTVFLLYIGKNKMI